ncbi:hypothetical protein KFK14_19595 [Sphingobium phenoxybenzoativorans]|uniref:Uncharacterized protein n=1 Tax=Sphingobium phenoxybenzoativorans TaxID=1592790 RepID=A0A975K644_9SPHN|nr:hypothetical protein [Sphingobium phenoxybenzoativorans]QUT05177.1 hypothetical protein KFK14_19595 [Sphingobium phenoxybenzoativorans]
MFDMIDRAYYERRAREEIEKAENCLDPVARRTHLIMAERYRQQVRELSGDREEA